MKYRLAHAVIAVSFLVLGVTGVYIGHPFGNGSGFVMGWVRAIHFYFAIAFTLALVARVAWMFIDSLVPGVNDGVLVLLGGVLVATGFGIYAPSASYGSPMQMFGFLASWFGGLQTARLIHHVTMWLTAGFAVVHVYSSTVVRFRFVKR